MKKNIIQNGTIIVLAIAIIVMSLSYTNYSTAYENSGPMMIKNTSLKTNFANIVEQNKNNSITVGGPNIIGDNTVSFDIQFQDNSTYEFLIDIINTSRINGELSSLTLTASNTKTNESGTVTNNSSLTFEDMDFEVTYDNGVKLSVGDSLNRSNKSTIKVKVINKQKTAITDKYSFNLNLNYTTN